jgi:hypothetical protein
MLEFRVLETKSNDRQDARLEQQQRRQEPLSSVIALIADAGATSLSWWNPI